MTEKEFQTAVLNQIKFYPPEWRYGQKIFYAAQQILWELTNYKLNIARQVQFEDNIDCFYNDTLTYPFLALCYYRLNQYQNNTDNDESQNLNVFDIAKFIRQQTGCGLMTAKNALQKLLTALKTQPSITDNPPKLNISWNYDNDIIESFNPQENDIVTNKDGVISVFQYWGHHDDGGSFNDKSYFFAKCSLDDNTFSENTTAYANGLRYATIQEINKLISYLIND